MINQSIPSALLPLAQSRYNQWLARIEEQSLADDVPISETLATQKVQELLSKVLVASDYIHQWALKKPQWLLQAVQSQEDLHATLQTQHIILDMDLTRLEVISEYEIKRQLRLQRHYWMLKIAVADLMQVFTIREISLLQSLVADALIAAAYQWSFLHSSKQSGVPLDDNGQTQQLFVLAMGKLGGRELNFSSDIDLIFCFPRQGETNHPSRPIENQKFFMRLGQKLISLLSDNTADGFVYRVDMRLRPYGQSGALVANFNALQDYYLEQGREWERFAMIKARMIDIQTDAEDSCYEQQALAKELDNIIRPFSFRRYIDFSVLESIRQLKQKITRELLNKDNQGNIKLGDGGIRELEFIVQSLQLISGGRQPVLQTKNWWKTLHALHSQQLIETNDANQLQKAYEFLRKLENVLQIRADQQTQQVPNAVQEQTIVAFAMDYDSWQTLEAGLKQHLNVVARFFKGLFHDPHQEQQMSSELQWIKSLINNDFEEEQAESLSQQAKMLGLHDDILVKEHLDKIAHFRVEFAEKKLGSRGLSRLEQLLPHLIAQAGKQKNYAQTLQRCLEVLQGIGRRSAYFEMLAENLPVLDFLVQLVARSSWLAKQIALHPSLLDELLFPSNFGEQQTKSSLANQLQQAMLRIEPEQIEEQLLALSRFKQSSQFKIAAGDLRGQFDIRQVSQQLTDVAEVILEHLLLMAWQEIGRKYGYPQGLEANTMGGFLILGYGKLGGDELGYGSDLDLVFLYDAQPSQQTQIINDKQKQIDNHQFYTRLTQRLVHYLNTRTQQGIMYEVDTRLRPSGRSGLLVSHINAFAEYQHNEAWTWEHQALVRARPVVGDKKLESQYLAIRSDILHKVSLQSSAADGSSLANDVVSMRHKMREHLDKTDTQYWDIKQGKGGLVDIEFLVQFWVLTYAKEIKSNNSNELLPFNNIDWLELLANQHFIKGSDKDTMMNSYRLLRQIANAKTLQNQTAVLEYDEHQMLRQDIISIWQSTFPQVEIE
ncbi:MAG: bifunctional [glutamate--ammonia ligase]-adenylyl-L-tyrosine phosphorylase/[glutamate--ammonia-ligase] adenylyltransferase [Kangiellaceae bacterium]|nr:bifunctional [glutamate--ammonia ligase]-adenylyl-L-tyrosine phosphorylase/[glutamate--ammonia-ligase] adenylyltransferase [Kangiellaceae bacterium]